MRSLLSASGDDFFLCIEYAGVMLNWKTESCAQIAAAVAESTAWRSMRLLLVALACLTHIQLAAASTYFVSGVGHDEADGQSERTAFRTLQHAADLTEPGDVVNIMDGEYRNTNSDSDGAVLKIARAGSPQHWITYKAMTGQHPKISFNGWFGISLTPTASYIELSGLTVIGNNDNVTLEGALARGKTPDPRYDGNCIGSDGRKAPDTSKPNHIRILNNIVGKCGGGGIVSIQDDYVTIAGNTVYDSAWYNIYGCSGISVLGAWNTDANTGYKIIIANNRVFDNKELVPWAAVGYISDGEGIIIDTFNDPKHGTYNGRTLIANNLIYNNGSSAIEVLRSDHIDIWNNSTYANVQQPAEKGRAELGLRESLDSRASNNILYSANGELPLHIDKRHPCDCALQANLYYAAGSDSAGPPEDTKAIVTDPLYRNTRILDPWKVDLRVDPKSPALGSGVPFPSGALAALQALQPIPKIRDRGANLK